MATANNVPVKLVWRSATDGYFYEGPQKQLIRCDHSGDGRFSEPAGPDHCDHDILVLDIERMKKNGVFLLDNHCAALLPLRDLDMRGFKNSKKFCHSNGFGRLETAAGDKVIRNQVHMTV